MDPMGRLPQQSTSEQHICLDLEVFGDDFKVQTPPSSRVFLPKSSFLKVRTTIKAKLAISSRKHSQEFPYLAYTVLCVALVSYIILPLVKPNHNHEGKNAERQCDSSSLSPNYTPRKLI